MRRMLGGVAVAGLLCAACSGAEETVEITTTDEAGRTTVITQEVTQDPEEDEGETPPAPTFAPMEAASVSAPGGSLITFELPADWTIQELGPASLVEPDRGTIAPHQWCLRPPADLPEVDGCAGLLLAAGPDWLPGAVGTPYLPRQVDGWLASPGELLCPVDEDGDLRTDEALVTATPDGVGATLGPGEDQGGADAPGGAGQDGQGDAGDADGDAGDREGAGDGAGDGVEEDQGNGDEGDDNEGEEPEELDLAQSASDGRPLTSVRTEVDGREVHYETWRVTCSLTEFTFTPQLWHDPELDVLVKDYFGRPETALVIESLGTG